MFHYLYKTTCLVTNRWYIGVHSTKNLFDGYLGSGTQLFHSIEKYGADNHDRVWLEFFDSSIEAFMRETEIVTEKFLKQHKPACMNIKPGGLGGWGTSEDQKRRGAKGNKTMKYLRANDPGWDRARSEAHSASSVESYKNGRKISGMCGPRLAEMAERAQSDSAKTKRKKTMRVRQHSQGEKNSQYGTCWVSNSVHTVKIKLELLDEYISKGYIRGRKRVI